MPKARRHLKLCKGCAWACGRAGVGCAGARVVCAMSSASIYIAFMLVAFSLWPEPQIKGQRGSGPAPFRVLAGCIICGIWLGLSYGKSKCYLYAVRVRPPCHAAEADDDKCDNVADVHGLSLALAPPRRTDPPHSTHL